MSEPAPDANDQPNEEQINAQKDILLKQILSPEARLRPVSYTHLRAHET